MMAASAIANNGRMVTPHVLYAMVRDGRQFNVPAQYAGSPISVNTAQTLDQMLATSIKNEASLASVPGYNIAGKTGTAQIPIEGGYDPINTNASFIGWGPIDDPTVYDLCLVGIAICLHLGFRNCRTSLCTSSTKNHPHAEHSAR